MPCCISHTCIQKQLNSNSLGQLPQGDVAPSACINSQLLEGPSACINSQLLEGPSACISFCACSGL
eukprot:2875377-Pleurochrysis_carterae.AAC.1